MGDDMIGKGLWRVALFPICVIAVASGLTPAAAVAGTGFTWHPGLEAQISFPDAATNPGAVVSPVSCPVVNDCTALGQYLDNTPALNPHAVVLHEGAGGWGAATGISGPSDPGGASVGDVPYDLSCAAAGECTAVGF
jgi:hypothetical protein